MPGKDGEERGKREINATERREEDREREEEVCEGG